MSLRTWISEDSLQKCQSLCRVQVICFNSTRLWFDLILLFCQDGTQPYVCSFVSLNLARELARLSVASPNWHVFRILNSSIEMTYLHTIMYLYILTGYDNLENAGPEEADNGYFTSGKLCTALDNTLQHLTEDWVDCPNSC